jgi:hypothetical protein
VLGPPSIGRPALRACQTLGELIDLVSGIAMGEQDDKAKDINLRIFPFYIMCGMERFLFRQWCIAL